MFWSSDVFNSDNAGNTADTSSKTLNTDVSPALQHTSVAENNNKKITISTADLVNSKKKYKVSNDVMNP